MKNVIKNDIETMQELCCVVCMVPGKIGKSFQVSKWKNQLDSFARYTEANSDAYWVGYNNLRFDSQVVEWILRNYDNWHELSNLDICARIAQKAADVIHDANYDVFPEYREHELSLKQLDNIILLIFDVCSVFLGFVGFNKCNNSICDFTLGNPIGNDAKYFSSL